MEKENDSGLLKGNETILLVDDDIDLLDIGGKMLRQFGYAVLTAPTAEDALEIFKNQNSGIHLVILDYVLPGMSGRECLEEMLKINAGTKAVIASGHYFKEEDSEIINAIAKAVIEKPFAMEDLMRAVRTVLDG